MRTNIAGWVLLGLTVAAAAVLGFSQLKVGELFVLGSNTAATKDSTTHTVALDDVTGVLGHLFGVASLVGSPATHMVVPKSIDANLQRSKGNLLIVVRDAPMNFNSKLNAEAQLRYDITNSKSLPHAQLVDTMLSSQEGLSIQKAVSSLLDGDSLMVDVAFDTPTIDNTGNAVWVSLDDKTTKVTSSRFEALASALVNARSASVVDESIFDVSKHADSIYAREVAVLVALVPALNSNTDVRTLLADNHPDMFTLTLSSLHLLRTTYGAESTQYQTACDKIVSLLSATSSAFDQLYHHQAAIAVILLAPQSMTQVGNGVASAATVEQQRSILSSVNKRAMASPVSGAVPLYTCYGSETDCLASVGNCSEHGACYLRRNDERDGLACWTCKCLAGYAGEQCQYEDMSPQFWMIVAISVAMTVTLIAVVTSLASMDPGTNTLLFRTGMTSSRPKTE